MQLFTPFFIFIGFSNVFGLQYLIPTKMDKKSAIGILSSTIINLILLILLKDGFLLSMISKVFRKKNS